MHILTDDFRRLTILTPPPPGVACLIRMAFQPMGLRWSVATPEEHAVRQRKRATDKVYILAPP